MLKKLINLIKAKTKVLHKNKFLANNLNFSRRNRILLLLLIFVAIIYRYRGNFVVATINGSPVSRLSVIRELEKIQGEAVLDGMITEKLIDQEAKKAGFEVTQSELDEEIASIKESLEASGQTLEEALISQGIDEARLMEQIRLQKLVEKLMADKVAVTEEELATYKEDNKEFLTEDITDDDLREQLERQKISSSFQEWITETKASADIKLLFSY